MIAFIQRVRFARVEVGAELVGDIGPGILALIGVQRDDGEGAALRLAERVLGYRVFADAEDRMNLALRDTGGGLLLVPQFTLAADTKTGTRAGFSTAAPPAEAARLFDCLVTQCRKQHGGVVATGRFGAHMQVSLQNDGPVSFWLETKNSA
jgi:D-tyrosyl-tRNA(Tyr) deacylase